ncbi:hypothetical protein NM688_g2227 [Phlebia brevispora]|uniref:Uncharacterized protein n=1 Tax=Phlebia brevispora TaxID=194682 RepID=A0ACC1T9E7_9APHY|nr:hypothetical protein NM688_g2227 [Phlebia brevispora]
MTVICAKCSKVLEDTSKTGVEKPLLNTLCGHVICQECFNSQPHQDAPSGPPCPVCKTLIGPWIRIFIDYGTVDPEGKDVPEEYIRGLPETQRAKQDYREAQDRKNSLGDSLDSLLIQQGMYAAEQIYYLERLPQAKKLRDGKERHAARLEQHLESLRIKRQTLEVELAKLKAKARQFICSMVSIPEPSNRTGIAMSCGSTAVVTVSEVSTPVAYGASP